MDPDLIFYAYPVQDSFLSGQVVVGPCVLDGVFEMQLPIPGAGVWTIIDGRNAAGRIVMQGIGLGITQPIQFPQIRIRLESGLFFTQDIAVATAWTFIVAKVPA